MGTPALWCCAMNPSGLQLVEVGPGSEAEAPTRHSPVWDAAPMDYSAQRPRGLRPPQNGDTTNLTISVDLGGARSLDDVALYLADLATLVEVGQRWGIELSRAAVEWDARTDTRPPRPDRGDVGYEVERALIDEGFDLPRSRRGHVPPWEWA